MVKLRSLLVLIASLHATGSTPILGSASSPFVYLAQCLIPELCPDTTAEALSHNGVAGWGFHRQIIFFPTSLKYLGTRILFPFLERSERIVPAMAQHGVSYWKAIDSTHSEIVGCCGLRPGTFTVTEEPSFELGFHIVSALWGKGYATEAAIGVIAYTSEKMKLSRLFAGHHPNNVASGRVLTKLGFRFIREVYYPPTGLNHPSYELRI